jgi:hypothetical protein
MQDPKSIFTVNYILSTSTPPIPLSPPFPFSASTPPQTRSVSSQATKETTTHCHTLGSSHTPKMLTTSLLQILNHHSKIKKANQNKRKQNKITPKKKEKKIDMKIKEPNKD